MPTSSRIVVTESNKATSVGVGAPKIEAVNIAMGTALLMASTLAVAALAIYLEHRQRIPLWFIGLFLLGCVGMGTAAVQRLISNALASRRIEIRPDAVVVEGFTGISTYHQDFTDVVGFRVTKLAPYSMLRGDMEMFGLGVWNLEAEFPERSVSLITRMTRKEVDLVSQSILRRGFAVERPSEMANTLPRSARQKV